MSATWLAGLCPRAQPGWHLVRPTERETGSGAGVRSDTSLSGALAVSGDPATSTLRLTALRGGPGPGGASQPDLHHNVLFVPSRGTHSVSRQPAGAEAGSAGALLSGYASR